MSDLIANLFTTGVSDSYKRDPNMDRLVAEERFNQVEEKILETLNEEQKILYEETKTQMESLYRIHCISSFEDGLRLGISLLIDVYN